MSETKNCPHCNGVGILQYNYSRQNRMYWIFVKCQMCGAQGKTVASKTDPADHEWLTPECKSALAAWNMRYKENEK